MGVSAWVCVHGCVYMDVYMSVSTWVCLHGCVHGCVCMGVSIKCVGCIYMQIAVSVWVCLHTEWSISVGVSDSVSVLVMVVSSSS